MDRSFRRSAGLALLKAMCFEETFVQASLRQKSRHTLVGCDFATIIVEHGKGRPHRRIGCCIDSNPIILFPTNQASNDLITAMVAISTARCPSFKLDVPDLPDFQALFSCHRSPYLPRSPCRICLSCGLSTQAHLTYEVSLWRLRLSKKSSPDSMPHFRNRPRNFIKSQEQTRTLFLTPRVVIV